ncbi:MAG: exodeoxyribonuclease VII small subunit [Rikenellaceae bacterium]|jgi:exodeoxyribonuclease VII small subunit|nr:exodeoxyribonuclease VII small subunit [Rikenellaceae bacterium]
MEKIGYSQALAQIEAILNKFQQGQLDVDTLAADVRRATELIRLCRERLAKAEKEVESALKEENS